MNTKERRELFFLALKTNLAFLGAGVVCALTQQYFAALVSLLAVGTWMHGYVKSERDQAEAKAQVYANHLAFLGEMRSTFDTWPDLNADDDPTGPHVASGTYQNGVGK